VKVFYREAASDDVTRQFRYYLVDRNLPDVALRFRDAIRRTVESLRQHSLIGARYRSSNRKLPNLRSWPVAGFEVIRIFYLVENDALHVIRVLHGKRDLPRILGRKETP
jgi:toxin ParE1/3/4